MKGDFWCNYCIECSDDCVHLQDDCDCEEFDGSRFDYVDDSDNGYYGVAE